jgi:hypothetical protein
MTSALGLVQFCTLRNRARTVRHDFQNFRIDEDLDYTNPTTNETRPHGFMPFAFSGVTVTKSGDNQPASLVFPNNELSRDWAEIAVREQWIANVRTGILTDPTTISGYVEMNRYVAQITSGKWDAVSLELSLSSVLDAVGGDTPRKKITQQLVGNLPITSRVRLN